MSSHPNLLNLSPVPPTPERNFSPLRTIAFLITLIYMAEVVAMIFLYYFRIQNYLVATLVDGILMLVMVIPGLYYLQLKPLHNQIKERTLAEQALRTSEMMLEKVLQSLPVGVWIVDKSGKVIHGNPATQDIWAGARFVGIQEYTEYKGWWPDTGLLIEPEEWAASRAVSRGETSINEEINIEAFDGTRKIILNSAVPIQDEQNNILGAVVVNQDITSRKQHERELIQTNELLERFFASINTLIAYMDRDFYFIRVNEAYASSAGHPPEYFIGKNHFELYPHDENEAIFRQVVDTGEHYSVLQKPFEYPEYPDRGITYWDWSVQPVRGAEGDVQGVVLSLVDVTEQKRAEIQLAQQNQELLELSHAEHRQRELAEGLVQSTIAVTSSLQLEAVLDAILEQIHRTIPFDLANIALNDNGSVRIVGYLAFGVPSIAKDAMKNIYALESYPVWSMAYATRKPVIISNREDFTEWQIVPGMEWVRSYAGVPLIVGGEVIGFININSEKPGLINEQMADRLQAFAVPAALAIQNARLFMAEKNARQTAETLSDAALAMTQTLDQEQVLHSLLDHIDNTIAPDISGVGLVDEEERPVVRVARRYPSWTNPDYTFSTPVGVGPITLYNQCITTRKSQIVDDTAREPLSTNQPEIEHIRNWLLVPIITHGKTIGIVVLGKTEPYYFTQDHINLIEALTSQAAVAIQNAWLFQQVRSSSERLQSLARKLVEFQENERFHIARELHDEAGQALAVLKLNLGLLEQDPECPQLMRQKLQNLKEMVDHILEELHRLAVDLRPVVLDHLGLVAAIEQYAKNLTSNNLSVQFKALGLDADRLPKDIESCLYRIVQEALTNVLRHAQAKNVGILLERAHGKVRLFVEDDGIGFDPDLPEYKDRLGLVGMLERAEMFGGSLTIESSPGKGTSIIVEVPDANSHSYS